jgi:hypothetical protein
MEMIRPSAWETSTTATPPTQWVVVPPFPSEQCNVPATVQTPSFNLAVNGLSDSICFLPYTGTNAASAFFIAVFASGTAFCCAWDCQGLMEAIAKQIQIAREVFIVISTIPCSKFCGTRARFLSPSSATPLGARADSSSGNPFSRERRVAIPFLFGRAACSL